MKKDSLKDRTKHHYHHKKLKLFERHVNKTHHHHHHIPEFLIHAPEVISHYISDFFGAM